MNRTLAASAILAASSLLPAQGLGLEITGTTGPFVPSAGSVCLPVSCTITPQRTLNMPLGSAVNVRVFGAPQSFFLLAVGGPLACQTIPGLQNDFALGSVGAVLAGGMPPGGGLCNGTSVASVFGINIPAALPPGSQFVFQALTVDATSLALAFTSPVMLVAG